MDVAHPVTAAPRAKARPSRADPGTIAISVIICLSMFVVLVLLYALWEFWPTQAILASGNAEPVHLFGVTRNVAPEIRLFVIVAVSGALGGLMHSTRSAAWYVGHGGLKWRWVPFYLITIALGAGLASVFYLVIRGGVFTGKATSVDVNPYGFAAIAALVGLFTEQALVMLKRVASEVFAQAPEGSDNAAEAVVASGADDVGPPSQVSGAPQTAAPQTDVTALVAQTASASGVTSSSATLEGDAAANGSAPSYHFDYGTTTAYGQTTDVQTADAAGPAHVTAAINGLTAGSEYHFRLVVSTDDGRWTTGDDATFTTGTA